MKDCTRFEELISCLIDGEILQEERSEIDAHIAVCPECRALYDDLISISDSLSHLSVEPPAELLTGVMAKIPVKNEKRGWYMRPGYFVAVAAVLVVVIFASTGLPSLFNSKKADEAKASSEDSLEGLSMLPAPEAALDADSGIAGDSVLDASAAGESVPSSSRFEEQNDSSSSATPTASGGSGVIGYVGKVQFVIPDYGRSFSSYIIIYGLIPDAISDCEILFTSANETHIAVPNGFTGNLQSEAWETIITGEESDESLVIVYPS